jgi:hypothetical protein
MPFLAFLTFLLCVFSSSTFAADAVPATSYFPVLSPDATPDATPQLVPVATNHALAGSHPGITRAILSIHDEDRDANSSLATLSALAGDENETTIIVAPQFMLSSDVARFSAHLPDNGRPFATWQMDGWPVGDDSIAGQGQRPISSFTVVDLFLMYFSDRQSFPDLKTIIVVGYGTGATFVQRYVAFNLASDAIDKQSIDVRFIVANAPHFLYLTALRPLGGRRGFGPADTVACPDYNTYPFGIEKLNPYARHIGVNAAKTNYPLRFVTYLNASSIEANTDTRCGAMVEGLDSLARSKNYRAYLQALYGDMAESTQVFWLSHDARSGPAGLFGSSCGMEVLFGDGLCPHEFGETR